ncbi:hypothetical protein AB5I41_08905 [Sphingomonas sp. MMS24-JH45]
MNGSYNDTSTTTSIADSGNDNSDNSTRNTTNTTTNLSVADFGQRQLEQLHQHVGGRLATTIRIGRRRSRTPATTIRTARPTRRSRTRVTTIRIARPTRRSRNWATTIRPIPARPRRRSPIAATTIPTTRLRSRTAGMNSSVRNSNNDSSTDTTISVADSGNDSSVKDSNEELRPVGAGGRQLQRLVIPIAPRSELVVVAGGARNSGVFGDGALVASSTLSSYVTGVTVTFSGRESDGTTADNSLRVVAGGAFQNFAGMQALNQNTGAGASQNASVSVAASTG